MSKRAGANRKNQKAKHSSFGHKLQKLKIKLNKLEKRKFWKAHLFWPKFLRKPKIRFLSSRLKIQIPIPNRTFMFVISLVLVAFSIAGGAYNIVNKTMPPLGYNDPTNGPPHPDFFYPDMNKQYLLEGIIGFALIFVGFVGLIFIHQSTKHFYRPNYSYMLLTIGIGLMLFSFFSLVRIVTIEKQIEMYSDIY
ncbi:MAG: hypothetical protein HWN66_15150 [Candidatus Helarchaeota archaeon]|nr:hypothetical protein [Candidatus Helarchaeota archaeon]